MASSDVIRRERERRGWSQEVLARKVAAESGANTKQADVSRWEQGKYVPDLMESAALCTLFRISIEELAGRTRSAVDLSGEWWSAWSQDDVEAVDVLGLTIRQDGPILSLDSAPRDGELRLHEQSLIGWFVAPDAAITKGAMFFTLDTLAQQMNGAWVGQPDAVAPARGWVAMARDRKAALELLEGLRADR